jgi:hypothetical protein
VGGALNNVDNGLRNVIIGGTSNSIANGSDNVALGSNIVSTNSGNFLFSDSAGGTALTSTANHRFDARCSGGATFYSDTANTLGVTLAAGGAAWAAVSDKNMKDLHCAVKPTQILNQVRQLPIYRYNYKGQGPEMCYIGPCAQDWHNLFPSGKDPLKIDTIDPVGVALACCRALDARIDDEAGDVDRSTVLLERKIDELTARLEEIQDQVNSLTT